MSLLPDPPVCRLLQALCFVWAGGVLAIQSLWMLPVLRRQAATIIEGELVPDANYVHVGYVCLEAAKVGGLLLAGWQMGV
jgi:hypothetical protein